MNDTTNPNLEKINIIWGVTGPVVNMYRNDKFRNYHPTPSSLQRLQNAMRNAGLLSNWGHGTFQSNLVSLYYEIPKGY